ncbi:MAG: endonuclease/exonuclease/phosphatase family protein [Alloprevotella sp.]|nr:endonuclease/exonuclease/phosphatase family protein [Alloprevotella sp.]
MGKKKGYNIGEQFMAGLSYMSGTLLLLCAFSPLISPQYFSYVTLLGLAFPLALAGTFFLFLLTLLFTPKKAWICGIALLLSLPAIRRYFPINLSSPPPKNALHVLSFNTLGYGVFGQYSFPDGHVNQIGKYLKEKNADIVCLQEANISGKYYRKYVQPQMAQYRHHSSTNFDKSTLAVFSKYPIVREEMICQNVGNGAMAYWIELQPQDTLLVVNTHLLSYSFSQKEKENINSSVAHPKSSSSRHTLFNIMHKVAKVSGRRAEMVDSIASFLERHKNESMIVCGDFNDTPISYAYNQLSKNLKDAYVRTGNGLGRSYREGSFVVRIDHLFCSKDWRPYACTVDNSIDKSDHYPIEAFFKRIK